MAQLPPKSPTMAQKWPSFTYQTMPMAASQPSSWIDDFVDFSSAKRSSHRRSTSDPIEFIENETDSLRSDRCGDGGDSVMANRSESNGFERLDDEQLRSMFCDEFNANVLSMKSSRSSTASEQNSDSEEPKSTPEQPSIRLKSEPGEAEDNGGYDIHDIHDQSESIKPQITFSGDGSTIVDPKRVKRILANRQSAQRSRIRKLHYISELERSVTNLQTEVSTLSPRVAFLDHQRLILNVDNSSLKQRIAALAQDKIFKDAHQEALKKEIERLRRIYQEQNMNKADNSSPGTMASPAPPAAACGGGTDE